MLGRGRLQRGEEGRHVRLGDAGQIVDPALGEEAEVPVQVAAVAADGVGGGSALDHQVVEKAGDGPLSRRRHG